MKLQFRFIAGWILLGLLAAAAPLSGQAQNYRTYFFKPGAIKQILVYMSEGGNNNGYILNIYVDPQVEGNGILTFASYYLPDAEKRNSYFYLSQIAAMIRSGTITGVAYSPDNTLMETNPSPYFFSEMLPKGKSGALTAYRVKGFYSMPVSTETPSAKPAIIQVQPMVVAQLPAVPSLAGNWKGFMGMTFAFSQNGSQFTWFVEATGEQAKGTIAGDALTVVWTGIQGGGSAKGKIAAKDATGRATRIEWDNGVVFSR